jgi:hypothetical protein
VSLGVVLIVANKVVGGEMGGLVKVQTWGGPQR